MLECFFFQLAKFVLGHKQQRKLPINKTREAINKKGLRVKVQKEEMKCSVDGEKEAFLLWCKVQSQEQSKMKN